MRCCDERAPEPARTRHRKPAYRLDDAGQIPRQENCGWGLPRQNTEAPSPAILTRYPNERATITGCCEKCGLAVESTKVVHPGCWGEAVVTTHTNPTPKEAWMNIHKNARLTPQGRALLVRRRHQGWRVKDAAGAAGISLRQAFRWLARHRAGGQPALNDRSSAPARCRRTNPTTPPKSSNSAASA